MKKIRVILPSATVGHVPDEEEKFLAITLPETEISVVELDRGPYAIENDFDIGLALPNILDKIRQAEHEGIQAVIIFCMSDLAVQEARRFASIPVIGPAESSIHYATILAHNFSIIGIIPKDLVFYTRLLRRFDLFDRIASIPIIDIPVPELLEADGTRILEICFELSMRAIREDGAGAIVLGFAGMPQALDSLQGRLRENGYDLPVINPTLATVRMAECLIDLKLLHNH